MPGMPYSVWTYRNQLLPYHINEFKTTIICPSHMSESECLDPASALANHADGVATVVTYGRQESWLH